MTLILFGLTGGIASGKSVVARIFAARGLPVIDADQVARQAVTKDSEGLAEIVGAFGSGVLDAFGNLDRSKLANKVFADTDARKKLEAITHPHIFKLTQSIAKNIADLHHPLAAFEAALLVENDLADAYRPLVVVAADSATQIARLVARDGLSEAQARARIAVQAPLPDKIAVADHVIDTTCSIEQVRKRSDFVLRAICAYTGVDASRYGLGDGSTSTA